MKKILLLAFLIIGIFGLCCHTLAFAANANVAGKWLIIVSEPLMCDIHGSITVVIDGAGTNTSPFDSQAPAATAFYVDVSQTGDDTLSGGSTDNSTPGSAVTESLIGKIINNDVSFKIIRTIKGEYADAKGTSKDTIVSTYNFTGKVSGQTISGNVAISASYSSEIRVAHGITTISASGSCSSTFTGNIISLFDTYILSGPDENTSLTSATFTYTGVSLVGISGYLYKLDNKPQVPTTQTSVTFTNLSVGEHIFSVAAKDKSGTVDPTPAVYKFTVQEAKQPEPPSTSRLGRPLYSPEAKVADPINSTTGNMFVIINDLAIPGKSLNFSFTRAYNSRDTYGGPLGYGWTHSYNVKLTPNTDASNVEIRDEEGRGYLFVFNPNNNSYISQRGEYSTLTKSATAFTWTKKDGKQYIFDLKGKLTQIKDRYDNTISLSYNSQNQLITVIDSAGRKINLTYDSQGRIIRLTDPVNRNITYAYDKDSNLIQVTDPAGKGINYEYDVNHNLTRKIDALGKSVYFTYDSSDRCTSSSGESNLGRATLSFDPANKKTTITDSKGNVVTHYYNDDLLITKIVDAKGNASTSTWDKDYNRTTHTDELGRVINMAYDAKGNLTKVTDPLGKAATFTYEPTYNLVKAITDNQGNVTTNTYDAKGNLTKVTDALGSNTFYTYNAAGQVTGSQNALGKSTYFTYDAQGNLTQIKDALGAITTNTYDAVGNILSTKDPRGNTTQFTYDSLNRLIKTTYADNSTLIFVYDAAGNRTAVTDPLGKTTYTTYDQDHRIKSVTNALNYTTNYDYDTEGNLICVTDAYNNKTTYEYDTLSRQISQTDALGNKTQYQYDAAGNRTSVTDAKGQTTKYEYDNLNRLVKITNPDSSTIAYVYDSLGRRTSLTDSFGTTTYTYDKLGRLLKVDGPLAKDTLTYTYDVVGNRLTLVDPDAKTTKYAYDALNRIISITDPQSKVTTYAFDTTGNLVTLTYPNGTKAVYAYDILNHLTKLTNQKSAAPSTKLSEYTYTYDLAGRKTKAALLDGSIITYAYDVIGQLIQETSTSTAAPYSITYTYDPAGNRTRKIIDNGDYSYFYNSLNQLIQEDTRLTSSSGPKKITVSGTVSDLSSGVKSITVNGVTATLVGNTFSVQIPLGLGKNTITVIAKDSLDNTSTKTINVTYEPGITTTQIKYTYDANGNLTRKEEQGKTTNLTYDSQNRLVSLRGAAGDEAIYAYDGEGKRVSVKFGSTTTNYIYDGMSVILERNSSGTTTASYIRNPNAAGGIGGIISSTAGTQQNYYHYDGLGSVTTLTNSTGVTSQSYTYDAFGNILTQSGSTTNHNNFLSKETDSTGLVYFGARYYDPKIGRFISRDPSGMYDGPNAYLYCHNDPINYVDLWGLCTSSLGREPTVLETIQLKQVFPNLGEFRITGEPTSNYNCIAWTLGKTGSWINPTQTVSGMDNLYASHGFKVTSESQGQVALFVKDGQPQHGAVRISGDWYESKLGQSYRIVHKLQDLEGDIYGKAERYYEK